MKFQPKELKWTREPEIYTITEDRILTACSESYFVIIRKYFRYIGC